MKILYNPKSFKSQKMNYESKYVHKYVMCILVMLSNKKDTKI